jgi:arsenite methyltransferase
MASEYNPEGIKDTTHTHKEASMFFNHSVSVIFFTVILFFLCSVNPENLESAESDKNIISSQTPIDCPLRKQGVNVDHMEPFEDTEKYIAFLERKDRLSWQKPGAIIEKMNLKGNEIISDIGAGSGYFTFRFSSMLLEGKVYAIDVKPEMLRHIHHKAMSNKINNIEIILAAYNDPKVPKDSDIVFICDVLHHVKKRSTWIKKLCSEMRAESKVVLVEFKDGPLPEGPPEQIKISREEIISEFLNNGFLKLSVDTNLLPYQNFIVFKKR